jgi:hypothetical protein
MPSVLTDASAAVSQWDGWLLLSSRFVFVYIIEKQVGIMLLSFYEQAVNGNGRICSRFLDVF